MKKVILLILTIFSLTVSSQPALALSNKAGSDPTGKSQRQVIEKAPWYDPSACTVTGGSNSGSSTAQNPASGKVYFIGDSITENISVSSKIKSALSNKGYPDVVFNSLASRRLSEGGSGLDGISAFIFDQNAWKTAGTIVVELGTNGGINPANIEKVMSAIKSNNPSAKVYWINVGVNNNKRTASDINTDSINGILSQNSNQGYSVIDWQSLVKQNPDYISDDGLGVHPFNDSGSKAYGDMVAAAFSGFTGTATLTGACECQSLSGGGGTGNLSGKDNEEKIWNYLISKGLTPFQAAGLMGNMKAEAGFEPRRVEYAYSDPPHLSDDVPANVNTKGQPGYGLVQWTAPFRKQGLRDRAAQTGKKGGDLGLQLDYLWYELTDAKSPLKYVGDDLKQTTSINEASDLILKEFERPARIAEQIPKRRVFAETIFSNHTGTTSVISDTGNGNTSSGCGGSINGGSAQGVVATASQELALYRASNSVGGEKYILGSNKDIPWCAAFLSYILKKAGVPMNGGEGEDGYYIPAVASVRAYFENIGTYHPARSGYVPQPGDVVIYQEGKLPYASHVNIVISVEGQTINTIGGNQGEPPGSVTDGKANNYNADYITGYGTPKGGK